MISAETLLRSLIGEPLFTIRGQPNTVLSVAGGVALVATSRSPQGQPVPVAWLQSVLDRLEAGETVPIDPASVGYRSAFLGAVLRTVPQIEMLETSPSGARIDLAADVSAPVLGELERRLGMWGELLDQDGPTRVPPAALRTLAIYGGASGVWTDASRTRGVGGASSVTVGVLHTGRHYPDELSDRALLYHYPDTDRAPGRDESEIRATKAAGTLRLPVFVVLQEGTLRTAHKAWVATWDDDEKLFLLEFGAAPVRVKRGEAVDDEPFELFEDRKKVIRKTRGRANQQRFKIQVIQRYGSQCAVCRISAHELVTAAHLVPDSEGGTSDPRNGLPFCGTHHTAFDRGLIAVEPQSTQLVLADPYDATSLGVVRGDLTHLPAQPATEALQYRWDRRAS